jgi:site-specific DNA-cytosine methylase
MNFTHIDLFSGIGGFIEAATRTGFKTILGVEIEKDCQEYLRRTYDIKVAADIKETDFTPYRGATLVTGGPPCQPVSHAGKRQGAGDNRWLWPEAIRCISEVRPDWFVFENPPGIKTMGLDGILAELENLGYGIVPLDIPACAANAPHLRHRIWIVGNRRDADNQYGELRGHGPGENSRQQSGETELRGGEITGAADTLRQRRGTERDVSGRTPGTESPGSNETNAAAGSCHSDNIREQQPPIPRKEFRAGSYDNVEIGCDTPNIAGRRGCGEQGNGEEPEISTGSGCNSFQSRLEGHAGHGDGTPGREKPLRSTTATAYDNYSLVRRWTGHEWAVSRVLRGFSGLDDGPRSRRVLETMGNSICVPVAVEILRAIRTAIKRQ